jgi:hypothetical protein
VRGLRVAPREDVTGAAGELQRAGLQAYTVAVLGSSELNAAPARMFHKTPPTTPHVEDAISRLKTTGLDGKIQLAELSGFQCFVIALEHRLRITTGRVKKTVRHKGEVGQDARWRDAAVVASYSTIAGDCGG